MREFLILPLVVVLLLLQCPWCVLSAGQGKFLTEIGRRANPASGGADGAVPSSGFIVKPSAENWPEQDLNLRLSSSCEETYGFMPCTASAIGNLFLMAVYGYLLFLSATYMSKGSEILLSVMGPGIIGGLFLPILGAFPDSLLILATLNMAKILSANHDNLFMERLKVKKGYRFVSSHGRSYWLVKRWWISRIFFMIVICRLILLII